MIDVEEKKGTLIGSDFIIALLLLLLDNSHQSASMTLSGGRTDGCELMCFATTRTQFVVLN